MKYTLEVIPVPVSDVARAKAFYADQVGSHLDFDLEGAVVQLTPPGSGCSIQIGRGHTSMVPGSLEGLQLVVSDLDAAHRELSARGVELSEIQVYAQDGIRPDVWTTTSTTWTSALSPTLTATAGSSSRSAPASPDRWHEDPACQCSGRDTWSRS